MSLMSPGPLKAFPRATRSRTSRRSTNSARRLDCNTTSDQAAKRSSDCVAWVVMRGCDCARLCQRSSDLRAFSCGARVAFRARPMVSIRIVVFGVCLFGAACGESTPAITPSDGGVPTDVGDAGELGDVGELPSIQPQDVSI